ncbi:nitrogen regulation protein NR(II) [Bacteroidota bacterium]
MEHRVISEFEKSKRELAKSFNKKFKGKLKKADIDFILKSFDSCIFGMIQLMKEGKSTHEKFFSDIILHSIDAIIGVDNDFKIFLWNKGAENIYGYKTEEVMGKDFSMLIPDDLLAKGEKEFFINEVNKKGFLANYETERVTKNGILKHVSISRFAVYNEKKESMGSVGIVRNITEETKLKKELREKENLALIGEVVSSIAHNLSNPLNIISGNADYLLLDKKEEEETYEELKVILDETTRITKSIRQLLNFSRPMKLMKESCSINEIINTVVSQMDYLKENKRIQIKKTLASRLPKTKVDKEQIKDVISNIIINSIQAIFKSGKIDIKSYRDKNFIAVEISDNGIGIAPEDLDKIFEPFFSTKGYGKGTGLGLAFTKRVIGEHEGEIEVISNEGKGTTFKILLPIV